MDVRSVLQNIKLFLFDMDGTRYLGDRLFPFTRELLAAIRQRGSRYLFLTNNSSKSVADYVKKLEKSNNILSIFLILKMVKNYFKLKFHLNLIKK